MLISLGVMSGVMALAAHMASGQLRFFRDASEAVALRNQVGQASAIAASILWGASSVEGDISIALDSAIEVHMPTGASMTCESAPGRVVVPTASGIRGNALTSFTNPPDAGDRMHVLFADTLGTTWLTLHVATPPVPGGLCGHFPGVSETWVVALQELVLVPPGAPLRFTRPLRLSLYRGSDQRWYMGAKDWNGAAQRFNSIQPVAGPLMPYAHDAATTGLLFVYRDGDGVELEHPVDTRRIASITVVSRAASARAQDSSAVAVALRNAR